MARTKSAVYSGSLKLNQVVGIRLDKGQQMTSAKSLLKPDTSLPKPKRSMKTVANVTSDGLKKS